MPHDVPRVLGIAGSLRRDSLNGQLLDYAAAQLPAHVKYRRYDELKSVAPFDEDDEVAPPGAVERLREQLCWADGLIIATPEYNSAIPGQLKNALDWASRPIETAALREVAAVVIGASTSSFGAVWAQAQLRAVLGAAGARVLDSEFALGEAHERFTPDGRLGDSELARQLAENLTLFMTEVTATAAIRTTEGCTQRVG
ncbi:NADPH-dependent FMN reductase [Streptomyces brasiliensis]|uniref:FMN reductase n=1 Tax=Streptomyces brasiliensis TaxID=1954 RepID=A0A917KBZ0_9ACTN|nr:NAD(P)H-dependent oxidoreductase [Streptomyces brasiliensis]GGJ06313.1 FMN reductase [Streptomyces brasiliensis]